jgi:hypothetical protein
MPIAYNTALCKERVNGCRTGGAGPLQGPVFNKFLKNIQVIRSKFKICVISSKLSVIIAPPRPPPASPPPAAASRSCALPAFCGQRSHSRIRATTEARRLDFKSLIPARAATPAPHERRHHQARRVHVHQSQRRRVCLARLLQVQTQAEGERTCTPPALSGTQSAVKLHPPFCRPHRALQVTPICPACPCPRCGKADSLDVGLEFFLHVYLYAPRRRCYCAARCSYIACRSCDGLSSFKVRTVERPHHWHSPALAAHRLQAGACLRPGRGCSVRRERSAGACSVPVSMQPLSSNRVQVLALLFLRPEAAKALSSSIEGQLFSCRSSTVFLNLKIQPTPSHLLAILYSQANTSSHSSVSRAARAQATQS